MLPYGKQTIEHDDIRAAVQVLQSDWLTTGPMVDKFEVEFARNCGVAHAVSVSNGTAALHTAMFAAEIEPGDEVIVPAISFVATANAAVYLNANVVFADIDPETLLIDSEDVRRKITPRTKAIVAMDYAGQACDYVKLNAIANELDVVLIADACHSLGGSLLGKPVGGLAHMSCFSLHPLKPITAGEGGVITTASGELADRMRIFRNHGINQDYRQRAREVRHRYDMQWLGFNYRLTDLQCAIAHSQLSKLQRFTRRRNQIAQLYSELLSELPFIQPLKVKPYVQHAHHLYVVQWDAEAAGCNRDQAFAQLRSQGIGVNVHYRPIYEHSFYQDLVGNVDHACPHADAVYERILTLPIFPTMTDGDVIRVVEVVEQIAGQTQRRSAA